MSNNWNINNVIENYKKVAQAKVSTNLYNIGILYANILLLFFLPKNFNLIDEMIKKYVITLKRRLILYYLTI